ncbi:hypothetical protein KQX54_002669 [Cotesia glomerata]|uniref:Uncharacterized protein n=1 Tax=Cotesia glomerata TaxID=32391 RepID=A0AAV7J1D7_COTGL|nr:hypothetical protein KQX54_002669 [Cotesia glomerata]
MGGDGDKSPLRRNKYFWFLEPIETCWENVGKRQRHEGMKGLWLLPIIETDQDQGADDDNDDDDDDDDDDISTYVRMSNPSIKSTPLS